MNSAAFCFGTTILYWDAILAALAVLAGFFAVAALYTGGKKPFSTLCVLLPLAVLFAFVLSRSMYWYCHQEQFAGLGGAFRDLSVGGYCLSGIVGGFVLAVGLLRLTGFVTDAALLLDCAAPGFSLALAVLHLSFLFNNTCRGKALISDPRFQRLPFAAPSVTVSGTLEYRFAAFFVEALLFLLVFAVLLWLYTRYYNRARNKRARKGDLFLLFLLFYSAIELVLDSTRNDASFFHFNAFISVAQILSAAMILGVLVVFSVRSVRRYGLRPAHFLCWLLWLAGLAGVGIFEYLVQRHGDRQLACYSFMSLSILIAVASVLVIRQKPKSK